MIDLHKIYSKKRLDHENAVQELAIEYTKIAEEKIRGLLEDHFTYKQLSYFHDVQADPMLRNDIVNYITKNIQTQLLVATVGMEGIRFTFSPGSNLHKHTDIPTVVVRSPVAHPWVM